jgi:type II secretory pathway pseudopilin PulG
MNSNSADRVRHGDGRPGPVEGRAWPGTTGFTLLELVASITLFSFIVISVLADREKSIRMSGDARIVQTVRYLAAAKLDEVRHDPEQFGDSDSGDFEEFQSDWQDFSAYSWEMRIEEKVAAGNSDDSEADYLFAEDEDAPPPATPAGEPLKPKLVRQLTFTVRYEPEGNFRPDLSLSIVTYLPPGPEEEDS